MSGNSHRMSLSSHITKVNKVSLSDNFCISYKLLKSFNFSAKKEKSNRSLNKLTNEKLDNQSVNFPKNKEQEQEKKKDDGRKKEIKSPPSPIILFGRLFNFVVAAGCFLSGISRSRRRRRFVLCFRPLGCPEKICKNKSEKVLHSLA